MFVITLGMCASSPTLRTGMQMPRTLFFRSIGRVPVSEVLRFFSACGDVASLPNKWYCNLVSITNQLFLKFVFLERVYTHAGHKRRKNSAALAEMLCTCCLRSVLLCDYNDALCPIFAPFAWALLCFRCCCELLHDSVCFEWALFLLEWQSLGHGTRTHGPCWCSEFIFIYLHFICPACLHRRVIALPCADTAVLASPFESSAGTITDEFEVLPGLIRKVFQTPR